ncbi:LamG-like jellyroll fold domain-containing protein [Brevundimonas sp. UBA7534]|uniref:LamG-like jellyroll fold domain-containing protein n=1 Tax=Brevundimonas sp. UBA7534 TaxID=1946138 RepID=UPI0025BD9EEA|nr:LamG-like jellyroll fold domain-containing protein [Brevundimonas sp. UBA7534]
MITRRLMSAGLGLAATGCASLDRGSAPAREVLWVFDNLQEIGGLPVHSEGAPLLVDSPWGRAVRFDGRRDVVFLDSHPLAGAATFTFEALFRPESGAFEQRWFHLQEIAPGGEATDTRILFEIRTREGEWWLDAFAKGEGYNHTLIAAEKRFPVGRWFHVAQTFDGRLYRSFVDGVLQAEAPLAFRPQGAGRTSIGSRYNRVSPFRGAVRAAAFSRRAIAPEGFVLRQG